MRVVLAGEFENAFMRACDSDRGTPPQAGHPYYDSLRRPTDTSRFHRCGTFIALSERLLLGQVDWVPGQGLDRRPDPEALGLERDFDVEGQKSDELEWFAGYLLNRGAFNTAGAAALSIDPWPADYPRAEKKETRRIPNLRPVNSMRHSQLVRILDQVRLAQRTAAFLVIGPAEAIVLRQIARFVAERQMATPIDLPDLTDKHVVEADRFAGGLLNFCPPDIAATLAVRSDPSVKRYSAKVREALSSESCLDSHRALVRAMREQRETSARARAAQTVFEVLSMIVGPLPIGPLKLVPKGMSSWLKRERRRESWHVLMSRMSDIAVDDYLRRMQNL